MGTDAPKPTGPFSKTQYRFTTGVRAGELVTIRDEANSPILSYRSFASVVGVVGLVVSVIVGISGFAAVGR